MKTITINVIQNGNRIKFAITYAKDIMPKFNYIEKWVKKCCGDDAQIENPDKLKKRLITHMKGAAK